MPILTLPQIGRRIEVRPGQSILSAALDAGVPFPTAAAPAAAGPASRNCSKAKLRWASTRPSHSLLRRRPRTKY